MTKKTDNSSSINDVSRCQHLFTNNMRCRLPIAANSLSSCTLHRQPDEQDTVDISTIVSANAEEFQTAKGILSSLSDLYLLLSRARISPRRASTLAYISSLQLRAIPMSQKEQVDEATQIQIRHFVDNFRRPYRGDDPPPARSEQDSTQPPTEPDPAKKPS